MYVGVLGHAGPGAPRGETVEKQNKFGKHLTSNFVFLVLSGPSALLRFTGLWGVVFHGKNLRKPMEIQGKPLQIIV